MKVIYICLAIFLLLFSSAAAFYGGYQLVAHPDGSAIKLPIEILMHTPFKNFYVPGMLLIATIGIFGSVSIVLTLMQVPHYSKYIIMAGSLLTVLILVQMVLSSSVHTLHYVFLFIGLSQLLCGIALDRINFGAEEIN